MLFVLLLEYLLLQDAILIPTNALNHNLGFQNRHYVFIFLHIAGFALNTCNERSRCWCGTKHFNFVIDHSRVGNANRGLRNEINDIIVMVDSRKGGFLRLVCHELFTLFIHDAHISTFGELVTNMLCPFHIRRDQRVSSWDSFAMELSEFSAYAFYSTVTAGK